MSSEPAGALASFSPRMFEAVMPGTVHFIPPTNSATTAELSSSPSAATVAHSTLVFFVGSLDRHAAWERVSLTRARPLLPPRLASSPLNPPLLEGGRFAESLGGPEKTSGRGVRHAE
eukprot:4733860-Pyramimonas_sp.AAC.1